MKIAILGPATSVHMRRWLKGLVDRGHQVHALSQHREPMLEGMTGLATVTWLPRADAWGYVTNACALRRALRRIHPDVLNVHYASGYGLMARLARFHPTLLSVWGSDVYEFPYQSPIKMRLIRWNLNGADAILSTSHAMADQIARLVPQLRGRVAVTPFGVDTELFAPRHRPGRSAGEFTIGTVKSMAPVYGIDTLIHAFALLRKDADLSVSGASDCLRLLLVGDGPQLGELQALSARLGLSGVVTFVGAVPHEQIPEWLDRLDVYVAASRSESFGVAVIEASACGVPVVVSNVGGLPEVVEDGKSGFVVTPDDPEVLAARMKQLVLEPSLRQTMGQAGRRLVEERFRWDVCIDRMLDNYESVVREASCARRTM